MSTFVTAGLAVLGVLLLAVLLIRTLVVVRRFQRSSAVVRAGFTDATGLLKARTAALRVAFQERRRR